MASFLYVCNELGRTDSEAEAHGLQILFCSKCGTDSGRHSIRLCRAGMYDAARKEGRQVERADPERKDGYGRCGAEQREYGQP
jgi:hypothetical protein